MKKLTAIVLTVLMVLSLGGLVVYLFHEKTVTGGASPEISFASELIEVPVAATDAELLQGVTATDAEDGDVTASLMVESVSHFVSDGTVKVTYAAFDSQNHVTKAARSVRYTDYTPPRFTLSAPLVFTESAVSDMLSYVGATDAIDGDLSTRVKVSAKDSGSLVSSVGSHEVEFRVTNSLGDTEYLTATVDVVNGSYNSAQLTLSSYLVYLTAGESFDAAGYLVSYLRDGQLVSGSTSGVTIDSAVDPATPGTYEVTYTMDNSYTRLIVVVE